jgi:hypothetical protein
MTTDRVWAITDGANLSSSKPRDRFAATMFVLLSLVFVVVSGPLYRTSVCTGTLSFIWDSRLVVPWPLLMFVNMAAFGGRLCYSNIAGH